jgi:hypothetical protein
VGEEMLEVRERKENFPIAPEITAKSCFPSAPPKKKKSVAIFIELNYDIMTPSSWNK